MKTDTATAVADHAVHAFAIDTAHSEAAFRVRHLLTRVRGRFTAFEGTIRFDEQQPGRSSVEVVVQAASIDTGEPNRDAHLRSNDFFAVEAHPTLTFVSREIRRSGAEAYDVVGDLTIRGVTKTVQVPVVHLGKARDPWGNEKLAFDAAFSVNRHDFGLSWNAALETGGFLVGDEVRIELSIQAAAR